MRRSDSQAQLHDAITLAQAGQRTEARRLLHEIVEADPTIGLAWMWLATVSTDREDRIAYLERALALSPDNPTARQAYEQLTGHAYQPPQRPTPVASISVMERWRKLSPQARLISLLVIGAALVGVSLIVLVSSLGSDSNNAPRRAPTLTPSPTRYLSPTPTRFMSATPSITPGPSPTPFTPPPTWTPAPSETPRPSRTPFPTSTPLPTLTPFVGPYAMSATAAFALTSDAPRATSTAAPEATGLPPTTSAATLTVGSTPTITPFRSD
jgi:hypothetical protein